MMVTIDPSVGADIAVWVDAEGPLRLIRDWQPIETAPVPAYNPDKSWASFRCTLQQKPHNADAPPHVFEGFGRWVELKGRAPELHWYSAAGQRWERFIEYWMPLPEPRR